MAFDQPLATPPPEEPIHMPMEVEVADPNATMPEQEDQDLPDFNANMALAFSKEVCTTMATKLIEDYEADVRSRSDWERTYIKGLEDLGMKNESRDEPWPGACGVFHPLLTEAVVRFQSETITETFPAKGPVRTKIVGKETPEKKEAAVRVEEDMNFQLTEKMQEFRPEHERMLWTLPATGPAFKKV